MTYKYHLPIEDVIDRAGWLYRSQEIEKEIKEKVVQRFVMKIGRNEPCPCNSGKKYKKCCLLDYETPAPFDESELNV